MKINILHRPDKPERFPLFELEQRLAHENGIRTTILVTAESMEHPDQIESIKRHAAEFGDEIGLSFHGLTHQSITQIVGHGQEALWLFSLQDKRRIIEALAARFAVTFGFAPRSIASYHIDASTMKLIREIMPEVTAAVAGCFEEGVRVFHGCNHSWYLFNEGMPWNPWYPSSSHTLKPARDAEEWCGLVAIPHLVRDMALSYEGRNDFWASHPPNVMRGMGYEGDSCPYDRNLIDLYRRQEQFNGGYAYYNSFVSTAWLADHHAIDDAPAVAQSLYRQQLGYLGELQREGAVESVTMSEFAEWFTENRRFGAAEVYFAKEMLYGSGKHYFWYIDADQRVLIDATQGGSIGDLRPYVGCVPVTTGPESESLSIGSYPYLIQSQHRTGLPNHSEDGARSTAIVSVGDVEVDLATLETKIAAVERDAEWVTVRHEPVTVEIAGASLEIQTRVSFKHGGVTRIRRSCALAGAKPVPEIRLTERAKLAPGTTEYPVPMHRITATVEGTANRTLEYAYRGRQIAEECVTAVETVFPMANTRVQLTPRDSGTWSGCVCEGHLFSPYITQSISRVIVNNEETEVWLTISKSRQ